MGKSEEAYQRLFQAIREGWEAVELSSSIT